MIDTSDWGDFAWIKTEHRPPDPKRLRVVDVQPVGAVQRAWCRKSETDGILQGLGLGWMPLPAEGATLVITEYPELAKRCAGRWDEFYELPDGHFGLPVQQGRVAA